MIHHGQVRQSCGWCEEYHQQYEPEWKDSAEEALTDWFNHQVAAHSTTISSDADVASDA